MISARSRAVSFLRRCLKTLDKDSTSSGESSYQVFGDPALLCVDATAIVHDAFFNTASGSITVQAYAFFGHGVYILTGTHDVQKFGLARQQSVPDTGRDIVIEEGAWIASGAMLLGPCRIGRHAVVGAGSLVTSDVAAYTVVVGRPATIVRHLNADR